MDFDNNFFKIDRTDTLPQKGKILIAEPFLKDYYFKRSIVLLTEHSEQGSIGFILNKPVKMKFEELIPEITTFNTSISIGGPVGVDAIHYLHTLGDVIPQSLKINNSLYWGGDFETVKAMINAGKINESQIRFFLGYSGWEPKQLDRELKEDSWIVTDMNPEKIMVASSKELWKTALKQMGKKYELWSNFPEDPVLN